MKDFITPGIDKLNAISKDSLDTSTLENMLEELGQERDTISAAITALKNVWISKAPFKVGDRVIVTVYDGRKETCFISGVAFDNWRKSNYLRYKFNKIKKDGTMSGQSASMFSPTKIELAQ